MNNCFDSSIGKTYNFKYSSVELENQFQYSNVEKLNDFNYSFVQNCFDFSYSNIVEVNNFKYSNIYCNDIDVDINYYLNIGNDNILGTENGDLIIIQV